MRDQEPTTQTIPVADAGRQLDGLVGRVARREARIALQRDGATVAAIVSAADLRRLRQLDAEIAERLRLLEEMRAPFRDVPPEEIERETDRIFAQMREEDRRVRKAVASSV